MPGKQHHEVLVFRKTVWLSLSFDETGGSQQWRQQWRIYWRPPQEHGRPWATPWWAGLIPKPGPPHDYPNAGLPRPLLRAYAFTEWSFDTPKRPNGTDLWVPNGTHQFSIWYSWLNWQDVFSAVEPNWRYMGEGQWMATEEDWTVL